MLTSNSSRKMRKEKKRKSMSPLKRRMLFKPGILGGLQNRRMHLVSKEDLARVQKKKKHRNFHLDDRPKKSQSENFKKRNVKKVTSKARVNESKNIRKKKNHFIRVPEKRAGPSREILRLPSYYSFEYKGEKMTVSFSNHQVVGNGSFGIVFLVRLVELNKAVALKKVFQDQRFKNRELSVMKILEHRNVVNLMHHFFSSAKNDKGTVDVYLNLIMDFMPSTIYDFTRSFTKAGQFVNWIYVKCFAYQILRSINYLHSKGVCHRDIKPQNLLVNGDSGVMKLCDFGSAKPLKPGDSNVSYICSRYYRAPELIFGETHYTTMIDVWSVGCVICEMVTGRPIFPGENSVDQLVKIIKVRGTPTRKEILAMNEKYKKVAFPNVKRMPWEKAFQVRIDDLDLTLFDLLDGLLQYDPKRRMRPLDALTHPFFNDLRRKGQKLPNGNPLPELFDFTDGELARTNDPDIRKKLIPIWHHSSPLSARSRDSRSSARKLTFSKSGKLFSS